MDREEIALLYYFHLRRKNIKQKKKKKEKIWARPFISNRSKSGVFVKMYEDLLKYPEKFFNYVKMALASFDELLSLCRDDLTKQDAVLRKSVSPEEKLYVTLR